MAITISGDSPNFTNATLTTPTLTTPTLTSPVTAGTPTGVGVLTNGTAVASTSGTSIDFTSLPSWVKRITVMFSGVSTSGTSAMQVQLSTGTVKTSGYISSSGRTVSAAISATHITSGLIITGTQVAAEAFTGVFTISNFGTNWFGNGGVSSGSTYFFSSGGVDLAGVLSAIRITTVNGTDTFDAGSINILYE
jgi:hypothetical protein